MGCITFVLPNPRVMRIPPPIFGSMLLAVACCAPSLAIAQALEVTLAAPDHNGYHISCFGGRDGAIDATVTGGTPPYTYSWSNGFTTEDIADLASGLYILRVSDDASAEVTAEITLIEPVALKVTMEPFIYPSGFNVSCHECFNGSIDVSVTHGVAPYAYAWDDGPTAPDRSSLGALAYRMLVTDANGCELRSEKMQLTQPERKDWRMEGNADTDPNSQYIGTSDEQDVVFKSNGAERLRIRSNGDFSLLGNGALEKGFMYLNEEGILKIGSGPYNDVPVGLCYYLGSHPFWQTQGNDFTQLCPEEEPLLGTLSNHPLKVVVNGVQRMIITSNGKVGIGTVPPGSSAYRLFVEDGISTRDVLVKLDDWPDYVFADGYRLMPLSELRAFVKSHSHLPGIPSAAELEANGGLVLGDIARDLTRTVEEQTLYILQLEERVLDAEERMRTMEQRLNALETSK